MPELTGPIPNPFRAFNNMTYGVSIYLQSHKKYVEMMNSGKKDVSGLELLIQSGGATHDPLEEQTATTYNYGAKRNKFFPRDFYLDDIQMESLISGTSTGGPANTFNLNFSVTEPMGLTFTNRLFNASRTAAEELGIKNFNPINQIYLMVIRFYGYDENGRQILNGRFDEGSDPNSFIEKWIPFMITKLDFRLETSKVKYELHCVCPQTQIAQGQIHGTIPHGVGLQGEKLKDVLIGSGTGKAAGGVANLGLETALNTYQKKLVDKGDYELANKYHIEFQDNVNLANASMLPPGTKSATRNAMPSKKQNTPSAASTTAAELKMGQSLSANAGMKIMKFIDLAVRSSRYMSDQYKQIHDQNRDKSSKLKPGQNKTLNWFKIRPRIDNVIGFDKKRQSWAYEITYVITVFPVPSVVTNEFNNENCFPVHKSYDIWFTGQNTEVLDFSQELNTFYFTSFSSKHLANPDESPSQQNNLSQQYVHRVNSEEAHTGENLTDEQAANAASYLYSPADMANIDLNIVGDPDWLSQSELFYAATSNPGDPVLTDGSVNYDQAEVYFSVNYNTVVDYELDTGLADVIAKNVSRNLDGSFPGSTAQYQFVYRANTIVTQLEKGTFKQQLRGTLVFIPEECITGQPPQDNN